MILGVVLLLPLPAFAAGKVVISQVYGGGGNTGAAYKNDYIELFNAGDSTISLNGLSVQYASSTGSFSASSNTVALTNVSLQPGQYYLIQGAAGTGGTTSLPAADVSFSTNLSGAAGKVALVNSSALLTVACPASASAVIDFVGFGNTTGSTANCSEPVGSGTSSTNNVPTLSNTTAAVRNLHGCTDTDNNNSDFSVTTVASGSPATVTFVARNTGTTLNPCGAPVSTPPSGTGAASPASVFVGGATLLTVKVTAGTNPTSAIQSVTADLSSIGGSATQAFYDDGSNGDATSGDGTYSFSATVTGSNGPKSLPVTITDALARVGTTSIGLTVNTPPQQVSIMQIQGHGAASTYAGANGTLGQFVSTPDATHTNIVTAVAKNGFYIQDSVGDNDVTTSDAVFVFTSSVPTVHVGDAVNVTGQVQEFNGATEITGTPSITILSSNNQLPPAYVFDINPPSTSPISGICMGSGSTINPAVDGYQASNFACLDGMLVAMNDGVVTGATFASGADGVHTGVPSGFYATVGSQPRPFREKGAMFPGLGGSIPVWDGDPEIVEVYYPGLAFDATNYIYNAGQHFGITGVIQNFKGTYEIYPITMNTIGSAPNYPVPVADSVAGTLTIGTQNMLHFFNSSADGADTSQYTDNCAGTGSSDTCPTAGEYAIRLQKMSKQIRDVLKAPAVLGVEEGENYSVLSDLAGQISADGGPVYRPYLIAGNDPGGINVGVLVRSDVTVNSATQMYKGTMTNSCSSNPPCLLNDRPPLLLDAVYNGYHFNLLVIYDRSLINLGVNDYVGTKRTEEAVQVAGIVQALQSGATLVGVGNAQQDSAGVVTTGSFDVTGNASVPLIVVGDFNAYEFTDGYVDVTGMIMGTAVQAENFYWDKSGTYLAPFPALFDSGTAANPADHYSYNFSGYAQEIDHILLSSVAQNDFIAISNAHGNSDVSEAGPAVLDASTAARTSDHDGQIVTLGYVVSASAGTHGSISPTGLRTVSRNSQSVFTITADTGYSASVGGSCGGNLSGSTYVTAAVTANCAVSAIFTINSYALTYTAGANGSVTGAASQTVNYGDSGTAVTAVPDMGYHFTGWSDGSSANPRTDANVTASISVTANFAINTYTVSASAGSGGSVDQTSQGVDYNGTVAFIFTPNTGYHFNVIGATCPGSFNGTTGVYSAGPITADCSIGASFAINTYTLAYAAGANGSLAGTTSQTVSYGDSGSAVSAVPAAGYHFIGWSDGSTANPRIDANVTASVSVTALFANVYTVTPAVGPHGTLSPSAPQTVVYNHSISFAANPDPGYKIGVSGCGATVKAKTITTAPITANCTLSVSFSK